MQDKKDIRTRIEELLYDENVQVDEGIRRLTDDIIDIFIDELEQYSYKDCVNYKSL